MVRRQPEFSNGGLILSSTISRWNQVFSHQGRSYICVPGPGAAGVSKCIHYKFFARCISTPGQAALLFGKGSYSPVEAARRAPGEYVKTARHTKKSPSLSSCKLSRPLKNTTFQVDGRREVLALQVRARRMIDGYTK